MLIPPYILTINSKKVLKCYSSFIFSPFPYILTCIQTLNLMNQIINLFKRLRKTWRVYYRNHIQQHTKLGFKLVITGILLFVLIIISMFIFHSRNLPSAEDLKNASVSESTKIFDRDGELLYEVHGNEKRTVVPLSEMSDWIKKATIALEDDEFYSHSGYDIKAIARSGACLALRTVRTILFFLPDCRFSGASTITQQFVKNAYISNEVTINRKIKELILATRVEDTFTKDEILALYLNRIPYGGTLYGVEAASQAYFGIPAKDLSLMQSAIIASIPNKPSKYSPFIGNRDMLLGRAEYALSRMIIVGMIDEKEKEQALSEEIVFENKADSDE